MKHQVNISLQLLPGSQSKHPYDIVDKAIQIIASSGIRYKVCPFETVMEGNYNEIMEVIKKVQTECLDFGADSVLSFIKIQVSKHNDVTFEDKIGKYE